MSRKDDVRFKARRRPCNLCGESYRAPSAFSRFCSRCKRTEELQFADWLPDLELVELEELGGIQPSLTAAA